MESIQDNLVANPELHGDSNSARDWTFFAPRDELSLKYEIVRPVAGSPARLVLSGQGDRRGFSGWRGRVHLSPGQWYRASARIRCRGIEHPGLSIIARVSQHLLLPGRYESEEMILERVFYHDPENAAYNGDQIELCLTATERGRAEYFNPCVQRIDRPKHRMARVATARFGKSPDPLTLAQQEQRIADKLDQAGAMQADIIALTEFCPTVGVPQSHCGSYADGAQTVPDGPLCRILSAKAAQYKMHVLAGLIERRGKHIFNTAVLFDRHGTFIGQYDKTHLTIHELTSGISCGDRYPVFDLDFGRIGIHICYDEWFPEVARYYAHQGAEILFLPVAGGKPITWRTRALDNGIYFVSASINPPSMIIDSSGAILAQTHDDGIACSDLNLDWRQVNAYGDPTLHYGMPCIAPQMRNCLDDALLDQLHQSMKDRPDSYRNPEKHL